MRHTRRVLPLLFLLLALPAGPALLARGEVDYSVRRWHVSDGLPSESVMAVVYGDDGFLWIVTPWGVSRFDGSRCWEYPYRGSDGKAPGFLRVVALSADHGLLIALRTGGLVALKDGRYRAVGFSDGNDNRVYTNLHVSPDGILWAAVSDGTVRRIERDAITSFSTRDDSSVVGAITFAQDGAGQMWIANGMSLYRYGADGLVPFQTGRPKAEVRICPGRTGGPWVFAAERLWKIENGAVVDKVALPTLAGAHYVRAFLEDRTGTLWIGTRSQGVFTFADGVVSQVACPGEDISRIVEDGEGNIWASSVGGGLCRIRVARASLITRDAGLLDRAVSTVCQDADGVMWLGNRDGGFARLLPNGRAAIVPLPPEWPVISAVSVAPAPGGGIWGTAGPGIFRIRAAATLSIEKVPHARLPIIRCTYTARDGSLWLSVDPDRIGRFDGQNVTLYGADDGFTGRQVQQITEDRMGRIWCCTMDGGLFRRDAGRFVSVPVGVPSGALHGVLIEADDSIWLSTNEAGLVARLNGRWKALTAAMGMPENSITHLITDERGNFWIGSPNGIFVLSRREVMDVMEGRKPRVHPVFIGKDEGMADLSCMALYQPVTWRSDDGRIWFATRQGAVRIDPRLATSAGQPPPVRIETVACDDVPAVLAGFSPLSGFRKLEFQFSTLCLGAPESVHAKYRLDGFDTEWVPAVSRSAIYPQLRPGRYRFVVSAGLVGRDEESVAAVEFTVRPRWSESWYFRGALGLAGAALIAVTVRKASQRRLRRRLERAERESVLERERTRIAQNIHDDLGAGLTRVSLLTQSEDPAESAAQLEKVYAVVNDLMHSLDETVWAVNPKYDDLDGLAYYIGNFAQDFLADAGIRCRILMPDRLPPLRLTSQTRHHLYLCCKEALNNVVKHAAATEVLLSVQLRADVLAVAIADDGKGMTDACTGSATGDRRGNGLANMRTRMAEIGGTCEIMANTPRGTVVRFSVRLPGGLAT